MQNSVWSEQYFRKLDHLNWFILWGSESFQDFFVWILTYGWPDGWVCLPCKLERYLRKKTNSLVGFNTQHTAYSPTHPLLVPFLDLDCNHISIWNHCCLQILRHIHVLSWTLNHSKHLILRNSLFNWRQFVFNTSWNILYLHKISYSESLVFVFH